MYNIYDLIVIKTYKLLCYMLHCNADIRYLARKLEKLTQQKNKTCTDKDKKKIIIIYLLIKSHC